MMNINNKWHLIEANMRYGREGLKVRGMDLKQIIREKLLSGELTAAFQADEKDI